MSPIDTTALRHAHALLLEASDHVAATSARRHLDPGEWNAPQILGHVSLLQGALLGAASAVAAGTSATFDTRIANNAWTIGRVTELTGSHAATVTRIRALGDVLAALVEGLTDAELDTPVTAMLISSDRLFVNASLPLRALVSGFATNELPNHRQQLLDLIAPASV